MSTHNVPQSCGDANIEQDDIIAPVCPAASERDNSIKKVVRADVENDDNDDYDGNKDDDDDGVELALALLDAEPPCSRPARPPCDVDRLITSWRWKLRPRSARSNSVTAMKSNDCISTSSNHANSPTNRSHSTMHAQTACSSSPCRPFSYSEDCQVADVCTSITPDCQRAEVARRMPGRNWYEVKARFEKLCSDARWRKSQQEPSDHPNSHNDNRRPFFRFRRHPEGNTTKPECPIRKAVSKFR